LKYHIGYAINRLCQSYYSREKHNIKKANKGKHHQSNERTIIADYSLNQN